MPGAKLAFKLMQKNPNPGEVCLCSPTSKVMDCKPPFAVFASSEMMDPRNPYPVACMACIKGAVTRFDKKAFVPVEVPVEVDGPETVELKRRLQEIQDLLTPEIKA